MDSTDTVTRGAAVSLRGLVKHFGDVRAVDGVDVTIAPGEVVALLGPNGAGKSTTIDMLGPGRADPGRGVGVRAGAEGGRRRRPGGRDAPVGRPAGRRHGVRDGGAVPGDVPEPLPLKETLQRAGLAELAGRKVGALSGGEKQRVRFAVALASDPDLLVLDEPTVAMDVQGRREFWAAMLNTDTGRTVVFATHYLAEAEDYADRVVLLRSGRVVADGSVSQVRSLAAGRVITAKIPHADEGALALLPGVTSVLVRGDSTELACVDSDTALRELLDRHPQARDIEVRGAGLEAAFVTLTRQEAA